MKKKKEKKNNFATWNCLVKIYSIFPCLIYCLPLYLVYFGDDLQENNHTVSTTSTKEYSFEVAKLIGTFVDTTFHTRHRSNKLTKTLAFCYVCVQLLPFFFFSFLSLFFFLQKAEMQRLFTVKTLLKTNCAKTMSFASNFSRATNQTTPLNVENNF